LWVAREEEINETFASLWHEGAFFHEIVSKGGIIAS